MKVEDLMQELGRPEPSGEGAGTNAVSQAVKRVAWRSRRVLGMGRAQESREKMTLWQPGWGGGTE